MATDVMLTTRQVAAILGLTTDTVIRMVHRGELPGYRFGLSRLRVRNSDLQKYIAARVLRPEPQAVRRAQRRRRQLA